jgi:hypothetical protein
MCDIWEKLRNNNDDVGSQKMTSLVRAGMLRIVYDQMLITKALH